MMAVTVKLTPLELRLLTGLASDQLFRREFIDPKMPGHRPDPEGLRIGKKLVERLKAMTERPRTVLLSAADRLELGPETEGSAKRRPAAGCNRT